jgi:Ser/Thr protein kinase RdoA (MazF antagonist)
VENADDAEGLPEALTHANYHLWAAVGVPGRLAIVGWAGSGRGPRLPALAWLVRTAAEADADGSMVNVAAVMRGYSGQIRLSDDEIERLPAILTLRPLWLGCLEFRMAIGDGRIPTANEGWMRSDNRANAEELAARAIAQLPVR